MTRLDPGEDRMIEATMRRKRTSAVEAASNIAEGATRIRRELEAGRVPDYNLGSDVVKLAQSLMGLEIATEIKAVLASDRPAVAIPPESASYPAPGWSIGAYTHADMRDKLTLAGCTAWDLSTSRAGLEAMVRDHNDQRGWQCHGEHR